MTVVTPPFVVSLSKTTNNVLRQAQSERTVGIVSLLYITNPHKFWTLDKIGRKMRKQCEERKMTIAFIAMNPGKLRLFEKIVTIIIWQSGYFLEIPKVPDNYCEF